MIKVNGPKKSNMFFALCLILSSCLNKNDSKVSNAESRPRFETDSAERVISRVKDDSAGYYFEKQMYYHLKADKAQKEYVKTTNEQYKIDGSRYVDSSHKYSQLLQRLDDKSK